MFTDLLVTPPAATVAVAAMFVLATMTSLAAARRREACVRSRFEQHLAPAVVRRILERPGSPKLSGERREVTALFTDVEGFTAMTHHVDPAILVNTLDNYFEGMATIIIAYGGMIDKIVGDGVHALFNAPNDLNDHPRKAIDCAIALRSWSERFRHCPEAAKIGFGRTRIGLETGPAIVGDIGIRAKLDYTAHGDAVNVAARLEAANKELGSSICIGPVAASRYGESSLRPLGRIVVRGCDDAITVFEPSGCGTSGSSGQSVSAVSSEWREASWGSRLLPRPRCSSKLLFLCYEESGCDEGSASSRATILRSQDPRLCMRQTKDFTRKKALSE
jgi:adenylate cyclase